MAQVLVFMMVSGCDGVVYFVCIWFVVVGERDELGFPL